MGPFPTAGPCVITMSDLKSALHRFRVLLAIMLDEFARVGGSKRSLAVSEAEMGVKVFTSAKNIEESLT